VLVVAGVVLILYIIYLLPQADHLAGDCGVPRGCAGRAGSNVLQRHMKRGFAIVLVYLALLMIPIALGAALLPPIVNQVSDVRNETPPATSPTLTTTSRRTRTLNDLNNKYDITTKLKDEANKLPSKAGDAAVVLRDIGFGLVNIDLRGRPRS